MDIPGYDRWKLASPPEYGEEPSEESREEPMNLKELLKREPVAAQKMLDAILDDVGDEYDYDSQGRLWVKVWSVESGCHEIVMRWDADANEWTEESWTDSPFDEED